MGVYYLLNNVGTWALSKLARSLSWELELLIVESPDIVELIIPNTGLLAENKNYITQ